MTQERITVYELVGGSETFKKLVDVFYAKVEADAKLRAIFPQDLEPGKRWQYLFLMQYFGGPTEYSEIRGHPRLRMRHAPFPIDAKARDAWLGHMLAAIDEVGIIEPARSIMRDYFTRAADFMINRYTPDE
ncbi:MAG: globin [Phototrophicales bacterium]